MEVAENSDNYSEQTELEEENEDDEEEEEDSDILKDVVCNRIIEKLQTVIESHEQLLKELYFLRNGGDILDLKSWTKKPNKLLRKFLEVEGLDNVNGGG